ncbi:MAG: glycosyltransferase family 2 protein [Candidatus Aminicenantes bacterium]|nr:glycosyltransferase family 2 protein [Candidatus Aminicenantes bacterium]
MFFLSNLRIIGLVIGLFGLYLTFRIYRGPKWKKLNVILYALFSFSLIAVSLSPDILNSVTGILAMKAEYRGRLLTLLIFSNVFLWFVLLNLRTKMVYARHQFDLLIRSLGQEAEKSILARETTHKDILVIIPAYNEAENLNLLLPRIPSQIKGKNIGILVVDDGSCDHTFEVVKKVGCLYIRNKIHRGQGAASRLGYDVLVDHHIQIGITMDADNQHLPEDIEKLVTPIIEGQYDLVIGSRILGKGEKTSFLRKFGINFLSRMTNLLTGLSLTDCSSGFKAFNMNKMKELQLEEDQFQSAEVIIEAAKKRLRIGEIPITVTKRIYGETKKGGNWNYGLNFVKTIIKIWWR